MRILIPILAILLAVIVGVSMAVKSGDAARTEVQTEAVAPAPDTPAGEGVVDDEVAAAPADGPAAPASETPTPGAVAPAMAEQPNASAPAAPLPSAEIPGLRAIGAGTDTAASVTLGSVNPQSPFALEVRLTGWGGGVHSFRLARFDRAVGSDDPYTLEQYERIGLPPYAARTLEINGQPVVFAYEEDGQPRTTQQLYRAPFIPSEVVTDADGTQHVDYTLHVVDAEDRPVVDIVRTWTLKPDSYDPSLRQRLFNRTDQPLSIRWSQFAQGDVIDDGAAYLGDRRQFVTGYFPASDLRRVLVRSKFEGRVSLLKDVLANERDIWPNTADISPGGRLVWLAAENRYFALITHPAVAASVSQPRDLPLLDEMFEDVGMQLVPPRAKAAPIDQRRVLFTFTTPAQVVQPGDAMSVDLGIYAGPREKTRLSRTPYDLLNFNELIRYELGCTMCTFQPLAKGLLWFLEVIHFVVRDWGVAIIILVLVVRLLLHPITKRAQVNMMKMSKAMQTLQPEMEKLKKKYKDDQQKLSAETMKLYREKGVNPVNMLGCLPMFLQMPIWVALYAMLYLAIELRNEPAFYGIFQWISAGKWPFLASLSDPDRFIPIYPDPHPIQLIFVQFDYSSINLLPLLMGVAFFINMKFTSPPPPPNESDEQRQMRKQQQIMMRFMPFLMPLFLYAAPSGLTLYICASTFAGMLDSYMVRKHIKELEEKGELFKPKAAKERKSGGFMDRVMKMAEAKQREMQQRQTKSKKG